MSVSRNCINKGCNNDVKKNSKSKSGYIIRHNFCNTCIQLKSKYGLTTPERDAILEEQGNCCVICSNYIYFKGQTEKGHTSDDTAVVDHCHETGEVRGILCSNCNRALGLFKDKPDNLIKAYYYLKD